MINSNKPHHKKISNSGDFYSLSTLRDLIFHVQEHRFTLPQIKICLDELGLKFCGFENKFAISNFRELHGNHANNAVIYVALGLSYVRHFCLSCQWFFVCLVDGFLSVLSMDFCN